VTPPAIQAHVDLVAEATGATGANVSYSLPTATDSVDGDVPVNCAPISGAAFGLGHTTVTCSAHDAAGNAAPTRSFDVQVRDTTAPAIQAHADVVAEATGPGGATVSYSAPTASDIVDGSVSVTCAPASGTTFALGHTTVTCTTQDATHNIAHSPFDVLVHDTTPPAIQAHADIVAEASGPGGATVTYTAPAASDSLDGPVSASCTPASGSLFGLGHTTVTCSAHDAAGNAAPTRSFDVHVRDTTAPAIQAHADVVAEADSSNGATVSYTAPAASDSVDASVTATCSPASGAVFGFGHTTVTCSAHDASGNAAPTRTFDVDVRDTTGPAIQAHADVVAEATGPGGATVSYSTPTASDIVDGPVSVTCAPASGTVFAVGHTTVTCTAQDATHNVAHSTFDVEVRDTTAPVIQVPADMVVPATSQAGAQVTFSATATDAVDGTDVVTCAPASGTTFAVGQTIVTCSAQDAAGNHAAGASFSVFVTATQGHSAAVHALLDIDNVMKGLGLSHAVEHDLHSQLIDTSTTAVHGDAVATCQAFDAFAASAQAQLTAGQFTSLTPSIDAARTTLGC
jgi:hypothetical protein